MFKFTSGLIKAIIHRNANALPTTIDKQSAINSGYFSCVIQFLGRGTINRSLLLQRSISQREPRETQNWFKTGNPRETAKLNHTGAGNIDTL